MCVSHSRRLKKMLDAMLWSSALLAGFAISTRARADEPAGDGNAKAAEKPGSEKSTDAPKPAASADDAERWAKNLDSDIFVNRQEASRKLFEAGKAAIGPLSDAAAGNSLEATTAAVDILHRLSESADTATRDAAKAALEKLADGPHAAAAGLAKSALAPPPSPNAQPGGPNIGGQIRIGGNIQFGGGGNIQILPGGNIQILPGGNMQPGGAIQVFRIQANAGNGNRTVDVDDNGKKVHIQEDQNGIEVRVTEKVNGQDKTDTFKAKDAAELKQKSPEAHKLYEKYGQNGVGGLQIQAQVGGPVPNFAPPIAPLGPAPRAVPLGRKSSDKEAGEQIDQARKLIAEATDHLKKNGARIGNAAPQKDSDLDRAIEKLDEANQKLEEARQKLDR
ncbi:MAG TPA: hypothetical protein VHX65_06300 [Pirellulales bacterium]|jgi:hypothetical protein|nr:hypothetical protein [Pirellulales bacterium]